MGRQAARILAAATVALALVGLGAATGAVAAAGPETAKAAVTTASPSPPGGTVAGEYVNGAPVYRLPAVNVTVSRAAAVARIEQEDRLVAARSGPAGATAANAVAPAPAAAEQNVALYAGLAALGTIASILLSFGLFAEAKRRPMAGVITPRVWLPAQPSMPTVAPVSGTQGKPAPAPVVSAPVSLATRGPGSSRSSAPTPARSVLRPHRRRTQSVTAIARLDSCKQTRCR